MKENVVMVDSGAKAGHPIACHRAAILFHFLQVSIPSVFHLFYS